MKPRLFLLFLRFRHNLSLEPEVFNLRRKVKVCTGYQLARAVLTSVSEICWVLLGFSFSPDRNPCSCSLFAHDSVLLADFPPSSSHHWDVASMPNTTSCRKFMPQTLYVEVPGHGKPFLMLSHPCFPQDEEPEVRMAENLISDGPPSPVVCVSTSCHSIALSFLLGWGPPAVMERCAHLLENIIFM